MDEISNGLIPATLIHVEEEHDWREDVHNEILRVGNIRFGQYLKVETIADVKAGVANAIGPVVLIVDLRLDADNPNFDGLNWLMDHYLDFLNAHVDSRAYVLSGQVNEGILSALTHRGIPEKRIFFKSEWYETSEMFIEDLKGFIQELLSRARSMNQKFLASEPKVDAYLNDTFEMLSDDLSMMSESALPAEPVKLPMLLHIKDKSWEPSDIPDYEEIARLGDVVAILGSEYTLQKLRDDQDVIRIEASRSASERTTIQSKPTVKADIIHHEGEKGDQCLIGIIDDGIDVLHRAFADESDAHKSRILAIWDQRDPTGPPPDPALYNVSPRGTFHSEEDIAAYLSSREVPPGLGRNMDGHGTHVASIAAGISAGDFGGGVAPAAPMVVVIPDLELGGGELKRRDFLPTIGYSNSHVAALTFIDQFAKNRRMPVVVNVSQGMNGGGHDGKSVLELGFDNFTGGGRTPGCVVVKSAGNERIHKTHASLHMPSNSKELLQWTSKREHRGPDIIELWFAADNELRFRLVDPTGVPTNAVTYSSSSAGISGEFPLSGIHFRLTYTRSHPDNGDSRLLINIWPKNRNLIGKGLWTLEIESNTIRSEGGRIDAWIERRLDRPIEFSSHISDDITISVPGTSPTIVSVGSVIGSNPFSLANYSSYGPTRVNRRKPDLSAPGQNIVAARGGTDSDRMEMSGTSMAAPHVTGAVALLFSRISKLQQQRTGAVDGQLNANQVIKALRQSTQNYTPEWHKGMGFGVLDITEFIRRMTSI